MRFPLNDPTLVTQKYSTIVRKEKTFSSVSGGDRELVVEQLSRWDLNDPKAKFGVVITLSDPRREVGIDIHSMIHAELPNRYTNQVTVGQCIKI